MNGRLQLTIVGMSAHSAWGWERQLQELDHQILVMRAARRNYANVNGCGLDVDVRGLCSACGLRCVLRDLCCILGQTSIHSLHELETCFQVSRCLRMPLLLEGDLSSNGPLGATTEQALAGRTFAGGA